MQGAGWGRLPGFHVFAQITDNTVHSIQPEYLQTVSNARDNGQVRAMNGIYKSDPSLITLLLALCIPGARLAQTDKNFVSNKSLLSSHTAHVQ